MELFNEIYSCYYHTVRHILEEASVHPVNMKQIEHICRSQAFQETALTIIPKITKGDWPLLFSSKEQPDSYQSALHTSPPKLPLTALQRSWLAALLADSRFRLFFTDEELTLLSDGLNGCEPLYHQEDFHYYDRFGDGDSYASPSYREHFQAILKALRGHHALLIGYEGKKGSCRSFEAAPYQLQYSPKDDKFRLCCLKYQRGSYCLNTILNLERICDCRTSPDILPPDTLHSLSRRRFRPVHKAKEPVLLKITGERNSLERCMLHFASYEKHTEYHEEGKYWLCSIYYDTADETELLIDILSFGPVVEVLGPEHFLKMVKNRVRRQYKMLFGTLK